MKITLFSGDAVVCGAWSLCFRGVPNVRVSNKLLEELPWHDAIVTAGNSFGVMTGGIDYAVRTMFGLALQDVIQDHILEIKRPIYVGEALSIHTKGAKHGAVIYAPTMFAPEPAMIHSIFYATIAALGVAKMESFKTVAIPGLGMGCGGMAPEKAACLMRAAYDAHKSLAPLYTKEASRDGAQKDRAAGGAGDLE